MKRLYAAASLPEAYLLRGLLARAGIEVRVFNEHAAGATGEIPFTHSYPELWLVDERDSERAREVVDGYERRVVTGTRACPGCGEDNPDTFELCWRCGAPL